MYQTGSNKSSSDAYHIRDWGEEQGLSRGNTAGQNRLTYPIARNGTMPTVREIEKLKEEVEEGKRKISFLRGKISQEKKKGVATDRDRLIELESERVLLEKKHESLRRRYEILIDQGKAKDQQIDGEE